MVFSYEDLYARDWLAPVLIIRMPLTKNQINLIGKCLRAAAYGPFFPDGEFQALFGLTRPQVASVADEWPIVVRNADIVDVAVVASINNLAGYPQDKMLLWDEFMPVDSKELRKLFQDWKTNR